jgi:hypothetical protein
MFGIQDVFNILGYAMSLRGELGDVNDFIIFKLPRVRAQGAVSYVLAASTSLELCELFARVVR